jgi:hypothetical protein
MRSPISKGQLLRFTPIAFSPVASCWRRTGHCPVENICQFMRDNWLSNRVFKSYNDIVDHCCDAWNKLFDQP